MHGYSYCKSNTGISTFFKKFSYSSSSAISATSKKLTLNQYMFYLIISSIFGLIGILLVMSIESILQVTLGLVVFLPISFLFYKLSAKQAKREELIERGRQESARIKKEIEDKQKIINKRVAEIESNLKFKAILAKNVGGSGYPLNQNQEINFSK